MSLRLSEIYTSIQGEGPGIGWPTQFIRFAGCNLRCPSWPCDTQHAIDPEKYRDEWQTRSVMDVVASLDPNIKRVTLTGGEPLLQRKRELEELVSRLLGRNYAIEIFTNGTFALPYWAFAPAAVSVIMDWKLPGSGEDPQHKTRLINAAYLSSKDAIKFVCVDRNDFDYAYNLVKEYSNVLLHHNSPRLYVGAAWGSLDEATLATWICQQELPFSLNVQVHNYVWPRDQRRT